MIAVAAYHISYIRIYPLGKLRVIVPELPAGSIDNHKEPELVACIHECGILRAMGIAYHLKTGIAQLLCIAPVCGVGHRVSHDRKILMAVCTDKRLSIRLAVEIEALLAPELNAAYAQSLHKRVGFPSVRIRDAYFEAVELRIVGRPQLRGLNGKYIAESAGLSGAELYRSAMTGGCPSVGAYKLIVQSS